MIRIVKEKRDDKSYLKFINGTLNLLFDLDPYSDLGEGTTVNLNIIKEVYPDLYNFIKNNRDKIDDIDLVDFWRLDSVLDELGYDFDEKYELASLTDLCYLISHHNKKEVANYWFKPLISFDTIEELIDDMGEDYVNDLYELFEYAKSLDIVDKNDTLDDVCERTKGW